MAKLTSNINSSLLNTGMGVLGKLTKTKDVVTNPELENIFSKNEKEIKNIKKSMEKEGFRKEEPIVVAQLPDGTVLGVADGNTRLYVAKQIGLEEVYVTYRTFKDMEEAKEYARNRQFHRRNLSQSEIFDYANKLENVDEKNGEGRASERLAEEIGVSASTIEHARTVSKKASPEVKEKVKKNEMSINQAYETVRKKKTKKEDNNEDEDISESLSDNSGNPAGLNFNHSDGIERPDNKIPKEEDNERTQERLHAYESGFAEGFEKALTFVLGEFINGKTPKEIYNDEKLKDLSPSVISKFELPEGYDDLISEL